MRVAYFSPLPPERSGIADYSALLLPALRGRLDVRVVKRGRKKAPRGTDVSLYHVGNNPDAHAWIVDALHSEPGVVVLHDYVLHHLVAGMTVGRRDGHAYLDAMEREYGVVGRLLAHGVLDKRIPPLWESRPADYPLSSFVLEHAHSRASPSDGYRARVASRSQAPARRPDLARVRPRSSPATARAGGGRRRSRRV